MKPKKKDLLRLERNNAHVSDYLNAYRLMGDVDFAVMITGSWGSGKTEFVKRWAETLGRMDNDDKPDYLFVSLNGISTIEEIDSLLFRAAHPILGGKSARIAGKILGTVASTLKLTAGADDSKVGFEFSAEGLKDISFDKWIGDAPILIFDDIERCCVDIESLMGYFDDLLKNGKKVVLVCAEDEIKKRWRKNSKSHIGRTLPSYAEISSKVIGKRFCIEAEIEDLYGVLVAQSECGGSLGRFLLENKEVFVTVFKAVGEYANERSEGKRRVHNYRAFKHSLRDLGYWYGKMPKAERETSAFLLDFSQAFVLIDYALLTDVLDVAEAFKSGEDLDKRSPFERLLDLGGVEWQAWSNHEVGVPAPIMRRMVFNEKISKDELSAAVLMSQWFQKSTQTEWQQLMRWNLLEDDQVKKLTAAVLYKIETQEYVMAEEILHVFALLGEMATFNVYSKTTEAVVEDCKAYLDLLIASDKLCLPDYNKNGRIWLDDHGMGVQYAGSFDGKAYFASAEKVVLDAIRKVDAKQQGDKLAQMQSEFGIFPGKFYAAIHDSSSRWRNEPVFDRIDIDAFYSAYCSLSNENKNNVGRLLHARVGQERLLAENEFWLKLINKLNADVDAFSGSAMPPSVFQKKVFAEQLTKALGKLGVLRGEMR